MAQAKVRRSSVRKHSEAIWEMLTYPQVGSASRRVANRSDTQRKR